jgi:hypothetical protein
MAMANVLLCEADPESRFRLAQISRPQAVALGRQ